MVAPSQLHRLIAGAMTADESVRLEYMKTVLASGNLAVIRRIAELNPLSSSEKDLVLEEIGKLTASSDVSERDFGFHMLVSCEIDSTKVMELLKQNKTFSQSTMDHIQQMFGSSTPDAFIDYQYEVAEDLLQEDRVQSRDRGCHILITIASTPEDWRALADRLSDEEDIWDLRQKVLERFLTDCKDEEVLKLFVTRVVEYCMTKIEGASFYEVHGVAPQMHWVITALKRIGATEDLATKTEFFINKFGHKLPRSLKRRINGYDESYVSNYYEDYTPIYDQYDWR
jgi:hypothetical protein